MATTIVLKNSVTTTNTPSSLAQGEVAINVTDKKVWVGNAATTPIQIVNGGPDGVFTSVTDSGLTNTRVTYAGAGGLLKDSASITTDGTTLTAAGFSGPHNGTVGATTPAAGAFTTVSTSSTLTVTGARSLLRGASEVLSVGMAYNSSAGYCYIGASNSATPDMIFSNSSGTEKMRLSAGGVLYLNTTNSTYNSGASFNFSSFSNGFESTCSQTGSIYHFLCVNGNGLVGGITTSGTSTAFVTSSDYRLKQNVTPILNALNSVTKLKPVDYTWKVDNTKGQGFIAHELQEVCPQAVTGAKDAVNKEGKPEYQGVDPSKMVALLAAAIQELNAKVDAQAAEIAALKGV
jgi:hypothetical protein